MVDYRTELRSSVEGAIVNTENKNIISRNVEDAKGIAFGVAVARGANADNGCVAYTDGSSFLGITVLDRGVAGKFDQYQSARIMTQGVVWVSVNGSAVAGGLVDFEINDGYAVFKAGTTDKHIPGAVFDSSSNNDRLAKVRLA